MTASDEISISFIKKIHRFVSARVSDPNDADDIVQDIFLRLHSRAGTLRDKSRLSPWIFRTARNAVIDFYRTRKKRVPLPDDLAAGDAHDDNAAEATIAAGLSGLIKCLPQKYREAIELSEIQGLTQLELSKHLHISLSGAKSRVQRGRALLRAELMSCCHFEFDRRGGLIDYVPKTKCCDGCRGR